MTTPERIVSRLATTTTERGRWEQEVRRAYPDLPRPRHSLRDWIDAYPSGDVAQPIDLAHAASCACRACVERWQSGILLAIAKVLDERDR